MKCMLNLSAVLTAGLLMIFAGCGGGDDAPLNLTGNWDITLDNKENDSLTLMDNGGVITGTMGGVALAVNGVLTDNLVTFSVTINTNTLSFSGTVSGNGNSMNGTWVVDGIDTGTFTALRRGTGEGVDMTGTRLSVDLESSASALMQVTQNGNVLSGMTQNAPAVPIPGVITGNQVSFTKTVSGNTIIWSGYLSVDGNTVSGHWESASLSKYGGWRMTRQ